MAKKKRKFRAAKIAVLPILVLPIILKPCVVRDEKKDIEDRHIETRQNQESPGLVGHAANISATSTATVTTVSQFHFPEQFR
jgi:hypothetical protein